MILQIDVNSEKPLYTQIYESILLGIARKSLAPGASLPSVRQLGGELGVNLHTVNKAYRLLAQDGFVVINKKKGAFIAMNFSMDEKDLEDLQKSLTILLAKAHVKGLSLKETQSLVQSITQDFTEEA
jgi:DNA-binding transcriptional regulator YhcF (GntR family)